MRKAFRKVVNPLLSYFCTTMNPQRFTPQQALPKAKHYCAYQERCHSEVKTKLYGFGLNTKEVDEILSTLIEENYLNEERFAIQFAGGHFRSKKWGRVKIAHALKQKQVSVYCIKKALKRIDEGDYLDVLQKAFDEKLKTLKSEKNIFIKKRKLQDHLLQRGFENDLIREMIKKL
jgi:regulatory protein